MKAQNKNNYSANWKKVEAFEKKGLTKSALKQVMIIYNLALKEANDAQQIKSAMYQVKYRSMVEEDSRENNIFFIDTLISNARTPAKNILQSMQAQMLWQYLQSNRYKFYSRTSVAQNKSKDISTWSLNKLSATISTLYKASLSNQNVLQSANLDGFEPIIIKGQNTRKLRPTLFDFLAFRALAYFIDDENGLTKPAYQFTINNPKAFAPAADFVSALFTTKDTASLHYKALVLLQGILKFHLKDNSPDALLDADLIRLSFVNEHAVNDDKNNLYEAALKNIEEHYSSNAAAAQAMYLRAQFYNEQGSQFEPFTKTANQFEIKRAKELCEIASKKYPESEGGINAQNLLKQIVQPSLTLETEKVNIPGQPFRTLVNYKNATTVYFRIIKTSRNEIRQMDRTDNDKLFKNLVTLKSIKNWHVNLPDPGDYQSHAAEVKIDALETGMYFIISGLDENFSLQKNIIAKQLIYVSNISCIHNNTDEYYLLNRDNGQPLNNAQIQIWQTTYNYTKSTNEDLKAENYSCDKNGFFKIKKTKQYRNLLLQIKFGNEELFLDDNNYNNYYNSYVPEQQLKPVTFLFTDRSIYRPGQTIYFKGIVLQKGLKTSTAAVVAAFNTSIQLKDANNQKVIEALMITNEFGSYHGSFKLPEGTLNGQFSLYDSSTETAHYFNVEEYKRPKFFVEVQKPKGTYRLGDSINITGTAKAYAGNNIDGAEVSYRVVRKVRYPIWWSSGYAMYGRKIIPPGRTGDEMEVTNGQTITDANGTFNLIFKALPDESAAGKSGPVFYYEVSADITDINGETRSGTVSVAVAYQMLQLQIDLPDKLFADSLKNIAVKSTNLNDVEENTIAAVTIEQLKSPDKIFRERYWEQPDQFVMSRDEYYASFPFDVYKNENEVKNYEAVEKVYEKIDSTNQTLPVNNKFKPGWYKVTAIAKDKYGEKVKAEKYIELYSRVTTETRAAAIQLNADKNIIEPGENINYNILTGFKNIWLIHTLSKMGEENITSYQTITADKPFKNKILATEDDRGGMAVSYVFVQHNRIYKGSENFNIPWSNKELAISYSTFRDKLLPGSEEKWSVNISGNKGEKVVAEILAGMYDASLDQFKPQGWSALNIWPALNNYINWNANGFESINSEAYNSNESKYIGLPAKSYDQLVNFIIAGSPGSGANYKIRGISTLANANIMAAPTVSQALEGRVAGIKLKRTEELKEDELMISDSASLTINNKPPTQTQLQIRKVFNETAFFFPDIKTDENGNATFSFTMPEALTQWKLMTFAHTKNLASGYLEKTIITQKPLMVQPNAPRFLREGDAIEFSAKIVNLSDKEITGTTQLELLDAATNKPVDGWFKNVFATQYFTAAPGQSAAVKFPVEIPFNFNSAITYRITAKSSNNSSSTDGGFSDGEEMAIPILTNRMLVTESMPVNLRNQSTKFFKFEKLLNSGSSETLTNHALTVEYTSNPAWYAVQALPYLMEYPYECAEQTFNRYYANTLASYVSNSMPKIKSVFDKWRIADTAALVSNLQKNEELKAALLQETPWVLEAQNENQQKKNIALLFDMVKISSETDKAIAQLKDMQSSNGGFVWFKGGADDRYITQYIITGIGHLKKLNALSNNSPGQLKDIMGIVNKALPYLDKKIKDDYDNLIKFKANLKTNNLDNTAIQYLYMRSFFDETPVTPASKTAYAYYREQATKYWLSTSKYMQAMIALILNTAHDNSTSKQIIKSLKENSIDNNELGMYWKEWANSGYYWYQAPVESQALMIEAFTDIDKDNAVINNLKTWLLKQKQTQNWRTTKATAEACYALLYSPASHQNAGSKNNFINEEKEITITLGNISINSTDEKTEAGTGYFKKLIEGRDIKPAMGNINVSVISVDSKVPLSTSGGGWGSVYWQYFQYLDKITESVTPLQLTKKLFIQKNTDRGTELQAITDGGQLKVGDKVKVRIELKADRDMEYVHMKDMRAACMEPTNVLSEYKWQGGLGYYETTNDASTNFFFGQLPRGSYVFEYTLFVTHAGIFSNGITTIQCMYAPEFTSHSNGITVKVDAL